MVELKLNGKMYRTDDETASILMKIVPEAFEKNDFSAAWAVLELGLKVGRIQEVQEPLS